MVTRQGKAGQGNANFKTGVSLSLDFKYDAYSQQLVLTIYNLPSIELREWRVFLIGAKGETIINQSLTTDRENNSLELI